MTQKRFQKLAIALKTQLLAQATFIKPIKRNT
jgi:hypothetical protein